MPENTIHKNRKRLQYDIDKYIIVLKIVCYVHRFVCDHERNKPGDSKINN